MRLDLREFKEFIRDISGYLIIVVVMVLIFTFVITFQPVAGNSMAPTLSQGNVVLTSRLSYKLWNIKRNEIVVFETKNKEFFIKRIIGLPGEKIEYFDGFLFINGTAYKEDYLNDDVVTTNFAFSDVCDADACPDGVIPDNYYFVLGDNRPESLDSRDEEIGLINKDDIIGQVILRIWPVNQINKI